MNDVSTTAYEALCYPKMGRTEEWIGLLYREWNNKAAGCAGYGQPSWTAA